MDEDADKRRCLGFLFGTLGVISIGIAIYFFSASTVDTRSPLVDEFNSVVAAWHSIYRPHFAAINASISVIPTPGVTGNFTDPILMTRDTSDDPLRGEQMAPDIDSYHALKFLAPMIPLTVNVSYPNLVLMIQIDINDTGIVTSLVLPNISLSYHELTYVADKQCRNKGGTSYSGTCDVMHILTSICFSTFLGDGGKWNYTANQCGCSRRVGQFSLGDYSLYTRPYLLNGGLFSQMPFVMRSTHDPFIEAIVLTGGQLNFGNTQRENFIIGAVLICVGFLFLLPMIVQQCIARRERKAWERYLAMSSEGGGSRVGSRAGSSRPSRSTRHMRDEEEGGGIDLEMPADDSYDGVRRSTGGGVELNEVQPYVERVV